ncbi:MAG: hypothetical protein GX887_06195 [Firmicutes bacterium]|nr:hypothetical protein [Bacillota bacterium]
MKLGINSRSWQRPELFWLGISILNILIIVSLACLFFLRSPAPGSPAYNLTVEALDNLKINDNYVLYIYEHAGENSLGFRGHYAEGNLTGLILEHNVHILYKPGQLYIRHDENSDWENAGHAELAELEAFLTTPHEIMALIGDQLANVLMGPEKGRDDKIYKTVYWIIETPEIIETLFPALDPTTVKEGTLGMEIAAEDCTVCQFRINLVLANSADERQIVQRTLNISSEKQKV